MSDDKDKLREEYSESLIQSGVRGKFSKKYKHGSNVVLIEPELNKIFPDTKAVNDALRKYAIEHDLTEL